MCWTISALAGRISRGNEWVLRNMSNVFLLVVVGVLLLIFLEDFFFSVYSPVRHGPLPLVVFFVFLFFFYAALGAALSVVC